MAHATTQEVKSLRLSKKQRQMLTALAMSSAVLIGQPALAGGCSGRKCTPKKENSQGEKKPGKPSRCGAR